MPNEVRSDVEFVDALPIFIIKLKKRKKKKKLRKGKSNNNVLISSRFLSFITY